MSLILKHWKKMFFFLPLLLILISVITTAAVIGVITSTAAKKKELERMQSSFVNLAGLGLPAGLNDFNFFCVYESSGRFNAVLGDGGRAFGAYQFDYAYELQPFLVWAYERNPGLYSPFIPYLHMDRAALFRNQGLADAWIEVYDTNPEQFAADQDEYKYEYDYLPLQEVLKNNYGIDLSNRPRVIQGECLSIANRKGRYFLYRAIEASGVTDETSDEDFIEDVCTSFATLDGRAPGNIVYDRWLVDYSSPACGLICEKNMALSILAASQTHWYDVYDGNIPYLNYAVNIANDDSHGYSQYNRWGPDYDCSSLVYTCLANTDYPAIRIYGYDFYTANEVSILNSLGFVSIPYTGVDACIPGDVLWLRYYDSNGVLHGHTEFYLGNGLTVGAHQDEVGGIEGNLPGDQYGDEICPVPCRSDWMLILRKN